MKSARSTSVVCVWLRRGGSRASAGEVGEEVRDPFSVWGDRGRAPLAGSGQVMSERLRDAALPIPVSWKSAAVKWPSCVRRRELQHRGRCRRHDQSEPAIWTIERDPAVRGRQVDELGGRANLGPDLQSSRGPGQIRNYATGLEGNRQTEPGALLDGDVVLTGLQLREFPLKHYPMLWAVASALGVYLLRIL